jgi:hypothetical protein
MLTHAYSFSLSLFFSLYLSLSPQLSLSFSLSLSLSTTPSSARIESRASHVLSRCFTGATSPWHFWRELVRYFAECAKFQLRLSDAFPWLDLHCGCLERIPQMRMSCITSGSTHCWYAHYTIMTITGDSNLDHLVKMVPARFFTTSYFSTCKRYSKTMLISCFPTNFHPQILLSISGLCFQ